MSKNGSVTTVGARIAQGRKEAGLTQKELADGAPFSARSLQDYEAGRLVPHKHLEYIAVRVGRSRSWLLTGDEDQLDRIESKLDELLKLVRKGER